MLKIKKEEFLKNSDYFLLNHLVNGDEISIEINDCCSAVLIHENQYLVLLNALRCVYSLVESADEVGIVSLEDVL